MKVATQWRKRAVRDRKYRRFIKIKNPTLLYWYDIQEKFFGI